MKKLAVFPIILVAVLISGSYANATPNEQPTAVPILTSGPTSQPTPTAVETPEETPEEETLQPEEMSEEAPAEAPAPKPASSPTEMELAPGLEKMVKGTFRYFVDSDDRLQVRFGVESLDGTKTLKNCTLEFWLIMENYRPYLMSEWTTRPGFSFNPPSDSMSAQAIWDITRWSVEKLGSNYTKGLAQDVLSNSFNWEVQVKIVNAVFE